MFEPLLFISDGLSSTERFTFKIRGKVTQSFHNCQKLKISNLQHQLTISKMVFIGINMNLLRLMMFNVEKQTKKVKKVWKSKQRFIEMKVSVKCKKML